MCVCTCDVTQLPSEGGSSGIGVNMMTCFAFGTGFHNNGMTHLQVPVHNVMLVNVAHALQDLINAVTEKDKKRERDGEK